MCLFTCYFYIIFVYADVKLGLKLLSVLVCVSDFKEHRFRKVIFPEKSLNVNSVLFSCGSEINEKGMEWGCCQFCIVNLWILLSVVCYRLTFFSMLLNGHKNSDKTEHFQRIWLCLCVWPKQLNYLDLNTVLFVCKISLAHMDQTIIWWYDRFLSVGICSGVISSAMCKMNWNSRFLVLE